MSNYGRAAAVVVRPYIATHSFLDAVNATTLPCTSSDIIAALDTPTGLADLVTGLQTNGAITADAARDAQQAIATAMRVEVAEGYSGALAEMGFHVQVAHAETSVVWAERGDEVMAVEVHDAGGHFRDHAGLDGAACLDVEREVDARLTDRGITFQVTGQRHNARAAASWSVAFSVNCSPARGHPGGPSAPRPAGFRHEQVRGTPSVARLGGSAGRRSGGAREPR